ncbi:MAG: HAMP domain-containing sensor histidine kinase [Blastococcus sp.]
MTSGGRRGFLAAFRGTLRLRVTAVAALAVLALLSVASAGLVIAHQNALIEALDELLDQHADALVARVRSDQPVRDRDLPAEDVLAQVVGRDGTVRAASPDLNGDLPGDVGGSHPVTVELPGGAGEARLIVREVDGTSIRVAGGLDDIDDSTAALAGQLMLGVPLSTAVLAAILWWAVGRALRPVEAIRAQVDQITAAGLDQRVPEPATADEIARLARTMNAMLGRLEESADRQRRFVADASHELRSPLARMRAELEVDRAHPETADPVSTADSVLTETIGLQRLVDDLLVLARGDAGALDSSRHTTVDLDELVGRLATRARARGADVDTRAVRPAQVRGEPAELERAVANLLDNAVRHARLRVTVTLNGADGGRAELVIGDDGPGIEPADAERVFERFTRLDDARTAGSGGVGLGLAIARDIAERHGGSLTLRPGGGPGARFALVLPVAHEGDGRISSATQG